MVFSGGKKLDSVLTSARANIQEEDNDEEEIKEGFKIDPETGEIVEMTEQEKRRRDLIADIAKIEKRMQEMEDKGQILPPNF